MTNKELAEQIQTTNSEQAKAELWENTKRLFYLKSAQCYNNYSLKFKAMGVELDDLYQECYNVLLLSVKAFKPDGEYPLTAYFKFHFKNMANTLLGHRTKPDPLNKAKSLDEPLQTSNGEDNLTLMDTLKEDKATIEDSTCDSMAQEHASCVLWGEVDKLPDKDKATICGRYKDNKPYKDIAIEQGRTGQAVKQSESKALATLRRNPDVIRLKELYGLDSEKLYHLSLGNFQRLGYSGIDNIVINRLERVQAISSKQQGQNI